MWLIRRFSAFLLYDTRFFFLGPEPLNRKLKSINVDTIKANPDKFTSANEIGPYLIGGSFTKWFDTRKVF